MKLALIFLAFFGSFAALKAQEEGEKHPIETRLDACIAKDGSTMGMNLCLDKARVEWDKEMNRAYNGLMKKLPAKSQTALKTSQKAWLAHRDLEIKNIQNVYTYIYEKNDGGTMYAITANDAQTTLIKARALQLAGQLADIEMFVEGKGQ